MSAFWLKLIAAASMLTDHIGALFFPAAFRSAHRGARFVPTLCLSCGAEGAANTRRPARYLARLGVFALLSELPFRLAFSVGWEYPLPPERAFYPAGRRGVLPCVFLSKTAAGASFTLSAAASAQLAGTDYGAYGVLCVVSFYLLRRERAGQGIVFSLLTALNSICAPAPLQAFAVLGLAPCALYSGERGRDHAGCFMCFIPLIFCCSGASEPSPDHPCARTIPSHQSSKSGSGCAASGWESAYSTSSRSPSSARVCAQNPGTSRLILLL